mmetsp:Transcript_2986/g.4170  ORF Transcript_2986/g.4170 Transcript_2986/m.4170 type:complete len:132 (-) Transcript_2986:107-502(-)
MSSSSTQAICPGLHVWEKVFELSTVTVSRQSRQPQVPPDPPDPPESPGPPAALHCVDWLLCGCRIGFAYVDAMRTAVFAPECRFTLLVQMFGLSHPLSLFPLTWHEVQETPLTVEHVYVPPIEQQPLELET